MFLLKGTVRSYDAGTGAAEVEIVGSHGAYITVPVATHLDDRSVYAGLRCAVLCFDPNDQSDGVLVATYDELPLMGAGSVDHGSLDGLGDDDHTQYLNTTRHTAIGNGSPHHAPVTLGTFENATLNGQELNYTLPDHAHTDEGGEGGLLAGYLALASTEKRGMMFHDQSLVTSGSGAIARAVSSSQSYCFVAIKASAGNGDKFSNGCFLRAGTYTFRALGTTASGRGKLDWYVDGSKITSTPQDWYSGSTVYEVEMSVSSVSISTSGWHKVEGLVNGKNASSSGYAIGLTAFWFVPASD